MHCSVELRLLNARYAQRLQVFYSYHSCVTKLNIRHDLHRRERRPTGVCVCVCVCVPLRAQALLSHLSLVSGKCQTHSQRERLSG